MLYLFANILKPWANIVFLLDDLSPHDSRPDPKSTLTVKGTVDDHRFHGFRVGSDCNQFIFVTLKVPVLARLQVFHRGYQVGTVPRELSNTVLGSNIPLNQSLW